MEADHPPMATPHVSAGALFTDEAGRVLMVRPTYKEYWDIPGGYVEPGESPYAACVREVYEELFITPEIAAQPLVIDWAPADGEGDNIHFIFRSELTSTAFAQIRFADGELAEARYVDATELGVYTISSLQRRVRTALDALGEGGVTIYAEHGVAAARQGGGSLAT